MTPALLAAVAALVGGPDPTPVQVRAAAVRAIPLLAKAAVGHADQKQCFACHNQAFPMAAFAAARSAGLDLPTALVQDQAAHIHEFLADNRDKFASGAGTGGQADTAGWALFTLAAANYPPDDATAAVAEFLLRKNATNDHWPTTSNRPPTEASSFATTFVALRGLKAYSTEEQDGRATKRVVAARNWLIAATPKDTEDRAYRLRAMKEAQAPIDRIRVAAQELANTQRWDGGWGQLDTMPSDPYATATALVALHDAGGMPVDAPAYRRGLRFLLKTQRADGSWVISSRSKPFQPYYESGFPHGKNQFIAASATAWATVALIAASGSESNDAR